MRKGLILIPLIIGVLTVVGVLAVLYVVKEKRPHLLPFYYTIPYTMEDGGGDNFSPKTLAALNEVRETTKRRYRILSGYRSPEHNKEVGGASGSQHTKGIAIDLWVPHSHRAEFYTAAESAGFTAFGWGNNSVHIDQGRKRWWTYDDAGNHMSGKEKMKYIHKAPGNFKKDWGLE
jgi:hypothetical protein